MFLGSLSQLPVVAKQTNFSIFAADSAEAKPLLTKAYQTNALFLEPDAKTGKISVEMVREFTTLTETKDKTDRFFVVLNAETLGLTAENAFLKNLEEPKPFHHFVLVTKTPSALLPTILSRAQIFYLKEPGAISSPVATSEEIKALAKRLITADVPQLLELATEISKQKHNPRATALAVAGAAIEILYKSYFATNQAKFLKKLPKLLKLYDNLTANGHIKLHIVADML